MSTSKTDCWTAAGNFTAFVYTEDDQEILWPTLQSRSRDTEALEPLGFQRGFMRTEIEPNDGATVSLDVTDQINMTDWPRTVHLATAARPYCRVINASAPQTELREGPRGCVHQHYTALKQQVG